MTDRRLASRAALCGLGFLIAAAAVAVPTDAEASPWTLQARKVTFTFGLDFQFANQEWLIDGTFQSYPLEGRFFSANLRAGFRYGVTDRLEVGARIALSHISYEADEFALPGATPEDAPLIISFDKSSTGPGDVGLYARYRFTPMTRFVAAAEVEAKLPTGYAKPQGTFNNDDPTAGVVDDVTLGDGQMDLTPKILLGWAPLDPWFMRLDAGFRFRFFGPGHQIVGGFKTGVRFAAHFLPYAGIDVAYTVNDGKVVGQTFVTDDPDAPAAALRTEKIRTLDYRVDSDALRPTGGIIVLFANWEVDLNYRVTVWGNNTGQIHAGTVSVTVKP